MPSARLPFTKYVNEDAVFEHLQSLDWVFAYALPLNMTQELTCYVAI